MSELFSLSHSSLLISFCITKGKYFSSAFWHCDKEAQKELSNCCLAEPISHHLSPHRNVNRNFPTLSNPIEAFPERSTCQ
jgi:hypothetical protein